ncbi:MAG: DUF3084 domain-containing protein [Candidatus Eremiobacteraeota bacterium]|nr:DUF3084 domain-containing protein [Candidatus Eremiobacteraeota bacterium]MBV8644657.1 DUF3084 domain-containing protein [Candidatus Eremiobacteraeota bacterium]
MGSNLLGIAVVLGIMLVAGGIAYIGDRVGHQVGRKRLTLFGLRPKYTSTIVAVATGMLIALSVTLAALAGSTYVRTAIFRIGQINAQLRDAQTQALKAQSELDTTRNASFKLPIGYPIANVLLTIRPSETDAVLMPRLISLFDQTVQQANAQYARPPYDLRPYKLRGSDPSVQAKLHQELERIRSSPLFPPDAPVLLVPEVAQNLFRGDVISFAFQPFADRRLAVAGESLASLDVQGGQSLNLIDLQTLTRAATVEVSHRGMPPAFALNFAINSAQAQAIFEQIGRLRGHYRIVAKAGLDLYPHSGGILLDFALVPR